MQRAGRMLGARCPPRRRAGLQAMCFMVCTSGGASASQSPSGPPRLREDKTSFARTVQTTRVHVLVPISVLLFVPTCRCLLFDCFPRGATRETTTLSWLARHSRLSALYLQQESAQFHRVIYPERADKKRRSDDHRPLSLKMFYSWHHRLHTSFPLLGPNIAGVVPLYGQHRLFGELARDTPTHTGSMAPANFLVYSNRPNLTCGAVDESSTGVWINHGANFPRCYKRYGAEVGRRIWYTRINPFKKVVADWLAMLNGGSQLAWHRRRIGRLLVLSNACADLHRRCLIAHESNPCSMPRRDDAWRMRNMTAVIPRRLGAFEVHSESAVRQQGSRYPSHPGTLTQSVQVQSASIGSTVGKDPMVERLGNGYLHTSELIARYNGSFSTGFLVALDLCRHFPQRRVKLHGFTKHLVPTALQQHNIVRCRDTHRYDLEWTLLRSVCPLVVLEPL